MLSGAYVLVPFIQDTEFLEGWPVPTILHWLVFALAAVAFFCKGEPTRGLALTAAFGTALIWIDSHNGFLSIRYFGLLYPLFHALLFIIFALTFRTVWNRTWSVGAWEIAAAFALCAGLSLKGDYWFAPFIALFALLFPFQFHSYRATRYLMFLSGVVGTIFWEHQLWVHRDFWDYITWVEDGWLIAMWGLPLAAFIIELYRKLTTPDTEDTSPTEPVASSAPAAPETVAEEAAAAEASPTPTPVPLPKPGTNPFASPEAQQAGEDNAPFSWPRDLNTNPFA